MAVFQPIMSWEIENGLENICKTEAGIQAVSCQEQEGMDWIYAGKVDRSGK